MSTANYNDMQTLANNSDPVYKERIWASVFTYCQTVNNETLGSTLPLILHVARKNLAASVVQNKTTYQPIFVGAVSYNLNAANDATVSGTIVGQTGTTLAASALLVTDTHIDAAVSSVFNSLIPNV